MEKKPEVSASEKKKEDWMNSKWRPMMGWMYMAVCSMDFVIFPVLWSLLQSLSHGQVTSQWQPLTLQGAGLFHIAMGGVLGLAAYGRTQEKMAGANNGGAQVGTTYTPPAPVQSSGFGSTPLGGNTASTNSFGSPGFGGATTASFGSSTPSSVAPPGVGAPVPAFGSKPVGPAAAAMPAL